MEVRLSNVRAFSWLAIISLFLGSASCGKKMDMDTEYGRQARIDEANMLLSQGYCQLAQDTIRPLYSSTYNSDEATIIMAATYACFAGFDFLTLADNFATMTNKFQAVAKTMSASSSSDPKITYMYNAVDILSQNNTLLNASQRATKVNAYMVFLQLGVMGAILSGYGAPSTTTGAQVSNLNYSNPRAGGDMANVDACAVAAAISTIVNSANAVSSDADVTSMVNSLNTACTAAGVSCTNINRDRTACTGLAADAPSVVASGIITQVNTNW